jgi:carbonic anhydrase/acetyltransferase-like protein (isoleucine patch superfamily)
MRGDANIARQPDCEAARGADDVPIYSLGDRRVEFRGREWFVAPTASVIGSVVLEDRANVWFNVVIRGDNELITIGERVNIQDGSVLHADPGFPLTLARGVSVGHKAMLHGCTVGEGSLIGMNSVVMNGAVIGKGSIVGSNALVAEGKQFPDGVLILGSPGKVIRELKAAEIDGIRAIADGYVERARRFKAELKLQDAPDGAR